MARITDRDDWFELWFSDKKSILDCMARNMAADLAAGYNYFGKSITSQRVAIEEYKRQFDTEMDSFAKMTETEVNRWCYYNMKKRGAID